MSLTSVNCQAQEDVKNLQTVFSDLSKEDQKKVIEYAKYLHLKSKETDLQKAERLQKADNTIPSEETSQKIMEFSRYMMFIQKLKEEDIDNQDKTTIHFKQRVYNFGTVKEGEKVEYVFEFSNDGNVPLQISDVKASCGCTTPKWDKKPIPPHGKSSIKVIFDTNNKLGNQLKSITVSANTSPKYTVLAIKGLVE